MGHAYHPQCGCAQCCAHEEARERDEQLAEFYKDDLRKLPAILEEVALSDEENAAAAAALAGGDAHEFIRIWREARDRYVDELVETRADETGAGLAETAKRLCGVHS